MEHVRNRRAEMIEAGEDVTILRQTDLPSASATGKKRVPPHLAGPTANLSNELQAKDFEPVTDKNSGAKPTGESS
jgi:GTP-binding protein